jgi:thymidylate synthase
MKQYHHLLRTILDSPPDGEALAVRNSQVRMGLNRVPLVTTNPAQFTRVVSELLWFLRGDISTVHMRVLPGAATLQRLPGLLEELRHSAGSKRCTLVELEHPRILFHFTRDEHALHGHLSLASLDALSLWPFVFTSYSLLTWMMAQVLDLQPGHFTLDVDDCYIAAADRAYAELALGRKRLPRPTLELKPDSRLPRGWNGLKAIRWHHLQISPYKTHVPMPFVFLPSHPIRERRVAA